MRHSQYFKGWYFKCCADDKTIAFIPAYHSNGSKASASLQIITDDAAYSLPFNSLKYTANPLNINIGSCTFGEKGIELNIDTDSIKLEGSLVFVSLSPLAYDIMGPFALVPFMQCRHSVYSMTHKINGQITLNGETYDFHDGIGYTEGDRGSSFPDRYIWTQSSFKDGALMLSVADIPLFGFSFTGIIGAVMYGEKEYRIATYLGAKTKHIENGKATVKQGRYELTAELINKSAQPLLAPANGDMCRTIHESVACTAHYRFSCDDTVIFDFVSDKAGFESEYS